jgi:hypothetical protein
MLAPMRKFFLTTATILVLATTARSADAAAIVIGTRIPISPAAFALPVAITGAINLIGWEFALTYDPADVQVNTSCDPFSGDVYCSFLTGPVTEGSFFAAGVPFNLLNPGFVDLDATFAQTGLLFGVQGLYGGPLPRPSGSGTVAFVEFTVLGAGTSPITMSGSVQEETVVPEPGTLVLIATGLLVSGTRRRYRRHH